MLIKTHFITPCKLVSNFLETLFYFSLRIDFLIYRLLSEFCKTKSSILDYSIM